MNGKDEITEVIDGRPHSELPPPVILTQTGTVGMMDACGAEWPDAHYDTDKMVRLALQPSEMFGLPIARVPFDITAEAESLGCTVTRGTRDSQPMIVGSPWRGGSIPPVPSDLMSPQEMLEAPRVRTVIDAAERLHNEHQDLFLTAMCISPTGIAGHLLGMENMIMASLSDPEAVYSWMEAMRPYAVAYATALSEVSDNVMVITGIQSNLFMPEANLRIAEIDSHAVAAIRKCYSTVHNCGDTMANLEDLVGMHPNILSLEASSDPIGFLGRIDHRCITLGCLNPMGEVLFGSPEAVKASAMRSAGFGFDLVGPECGLPPHTPDRKSVV